MNIAGMRREILILYPGWTRVNKMSEAQVVAIYKSLQTRGKFDNHVSRSGREMGNILPRMPEKEDGYHQITIGEYLRDLSR